MSPASASMSAGAICQVPLAQIQTDDGSQARVKVNPAVVRDYAAAMTRQVADGDLCFPAVVLFTDGRDYWVGDGFHRLLAARQVPLTDFPAEVHPGSQRDALLYSISANSAHGLPRTNADKRKAVALLLGDAEWGQWSDREIARRCQVDHKTVKRLRRGASGEFPQMRERKVRRSGTVYEMTPAAPDGHAEAGSPPVAQPPVEDSRSALLVDPLGLPLSQDRADVFDALADFQEAKELFSRLGQLLDRIAQGPGGQVYRQDLIRTADNGQAAFACAGLRLSLGKLRAAEPHCGYCPSCHPTHPNGANPRCKTCGGRGWTTRAAYEACPQSAQQALLRLRS